jgi:hypothetical protein
MPMDYLKYLFGDEVVDVIRRLRPSCIAPRTAAPAKCCNF